MPWPVLDNFGDANGTLLSGTGVSVDGSGYTTRVSDSGSQLGPVAGSLAAFGAYEVQAGAVYRKTSGAGTVNVFYIDNPGAVIDTTVTAVYKCFTNAGTVFIGIAIHRYFQLRYYFQTSGGFTAGNWYVVDTADGSTVVGGTGTDVVSGTASFSDPGRFNFGTAGSGVNNTVTFTLTGTNPASTGFTLQVIVNGVTLGWSLNFTTTYSSGNLYPVGWSMEGNVTGTPGAQTGVHMESFTFGLGVAASTAAELTGPAVVGVGLATPTDYSVRGLVGQSDAGVMRLTLLPYGSVLGTNATFALSDGSGGSFGGGAHVSGNVLTITAGQTAASFTYTPATSGSKTITATPGGGAAAFASPTLATVSTSKVIMLDGDSLTDYRSANTSTVVAAANLLRWAVLLQKRLGTTAAVYDYAVSGQGVADQISDFVAEIQPKIQAAITAGANVYFVQYGAGNSINPVSVANSGFSTTQVGQNVAGLVSSICTSAKNLNAKVIVLTYPKRKNSAGNAAGFALWQGALNDANFNAAIDACNTAIRSAWTTYAAAIVDWASTAENVSPEYTTGRLEDGTHSYLSSAGVSHDRAATNNEISALVLGAFRSLELGAASAGRGGTSVSGN